MTTTFGDQYKGAGPFFGMTINILQCQMILSFSKNLGGIWIQKGHLAIDKLYLVNVGWKYSGLWSTIMLSLFLGPHGPRYISIINVKYILLSNGLIYGNKMIGISLYRMAKEGLY